MQSKCMLFNEMVASLSEQFKETIALLAGAGVLVGAGLKGDGTVFGQLPVQSNDLELDTSINHKSAIRVNSHLSRTGFE